MTHGLVIDIFAGGGGASLGIKAALGRPVDYAIDHNPEAVRMHRANHPQTRHLCQSVWQVNPCDIAAVRPVQLAWFSPDCKHFSKAKGGKPVEKNIRDLAWVVVQKSTARAVADLIRRFGLWDAREFVTFAQHGQIWTVIDLGMRMLTPRELYRAQGFPESTIIGDNPAEGLSMTKSAQVRLCGNSVCPPVAEALVRANFPVRA